MNWIYNVESWIKEHWVILIISLIILIVLFLLVIWMRKLIRNWKSGKGIKKIWKNKTLSNTNLIDVFFSELNLKFWQFEVKKTNNNKKIAWYALVGILTRVIANKYDQDYGNPREALASLYTFYKELREELKKYPLTFKSNIVILAFMNNELRPFLTKWNFLLNEKYLKLGQESESEAIKNEYTNEFIKDFNSMYDSIIKSEYIENLRFILGWKISASSITISDGIKNIQKEKNIPEIALKNEN